MASLSIPRTVVDGQTFTQQNNEDQCAAVETFINATKLTGTDNIQSSSIQSANYAAGSVDSAALGSNSVITAKIADAQVTTAKIVDANVTNAKLATSSVGTTNLITASVTQSKLGAVNISASSSSGSFTTNSQSYTDVTNLSVSFTVTNRPVQVFLQSDASGTVANIGVVSTSSTLPFGSFRFLRSGSEFSREGIRPSSSAANFIHYLPTSSLQAIDVSVSPGTYTYKLQCQSENGSTVSVQVNNAILVVREL